MPVGSCNPTAEGFEVIQHVPDRGLIATIDKARGYRVTPVQTLSDEEWAGIEGFLKWAGLKKKARRIAMAARWGDSEAFLEALYGLEDPRSHRSL